MAGSTKQASTNLLPTSGRMLVEMLKRLYVPGVIEKRTTGTGKPDQQRYAYFTTMEQGVVHARDYHTADKNREMGKTFVYPLYPNEDI
ncbi:hypothetical protein RhiTH_006732 [Rhizoctonia solani]